MIKKYLYIEKGQVIEKFDIFFTAMVADELGRKKIKRIDFEEVSDLYIPKIAINVEFEIHHFREIYPDGRKLRCTEVIF